MKHGEEICTDKKKWDSLGGFAQLKSAQRMMNGFDRPKALDHRGRNAVPSKCNSRRAFMQSKGLLP